jgi:hypothetical protein
MSGFGITYKSVKVSNNDEVVNVVNGRPIITGTYTLVQKDTSKFLKVYEPFWKMADGLSSPAWKIVANVTRLVQEGRFGHMVYCFNHNDFGMKRTSFYEGIKELIGKQFLFKTHIIHQYEVNSKFIYNGKKKKND